MPRRIQIPLIWLLLTSLFSGLAAALLLLIPIPFSQDFTLNGAQIHLSAERRAVPFPGDCLVIGWRIEGIRAVYLNGEPTIGESSRQVCIDAAPDHLPVLRVIFAGGSEQEFPFTIGILVRSFIFQGLAGLAILALFGAAALFLAAAPARPAQRIRQIARALGVGIVIALAAALVMEALLRLYYATWGTEVEKIRYLYAAEEIARLPARYLNGLPYVGYVPHPAFPEHNALGYRGPEITLPKPEGVFRIVALGGSTTYSTATSAEESYPAQLQRTLREEYGYPNVEVINGGIPGYTSWDTLVNYLLRVVELQPDMLIIYDGINDVRPRAASDACYQGANAFRGLNPVRGVYRALPDIPIASALYRLVAISLGWMPDPSALESVNLDTYYRCLQDFDSSRIAEHPPVYFERHLRDLVVLAQSQGIQVMLSSWVYSATIPSAELPPAWFPAIAEHNAILARLAETYGLPFYDLAATDFTQEESYFAGSDPIHLSAAGTREQARRYAAFIDAQVLIPRR